MKGMIKFLSGAIVILLIVFGCVSFYNTESRFSAKVLNITEQRHVNGSEGGVVTTYDYLVSTDKGIYKIEPKGFFACSKFGTLEKGKNYFFHTRGVKIELIGCYPFIVDARENER